MNITQLMQYISPELICQVVYPQNIDYLDIRLLCGAETEFINNCIYLGSLANISASLYQDKYVGIITTDSIDEIAARLDCIRLSGKVNMLALFEKLKELLYNRNIADLMSMLSSIFSSTNLNHIVTQTSRIMNNPVVLFDYNSQLLAACCEQPIDDPDIEQLLEKGYLPSQYVKEMRKLDTAKQLLCSSTPMLFLADGVNTTHHRLLGMIRVNQRTQATISVLEYNRKLTISDSNILGNICGILSQAVESRSKGRNHATLMSLQYENRLQALLDGESYDLSWVPSWLAHIRWERYQKFRVVSIHAADNLRNTAQRHELIERLRLSFPHRCVFLDRDGLLILINPEYPTVFQQFIEALDEVLPEYNVTGGISKRFSNIKELAEHRQQADDAIRIQALLGGSNSTCLFDDQISYELLLTARSNHTLKRYDDERLHMLREYDRHHGTDYYTTLYAYLQCACNRTKAAQHLFISRNTMDYRINKIRELLSLNDNDGEECLRLQLAFKAYEIEQRLSK